MEVYAVFISYYIPEDEILRESGKLDSIYLHEEDAEKRCQDIMKGIGISFVDQVTLSEYNSEKDNMYSIASFDTKIKPYSVIEG